MTIEFEETPTNVPIAGGKSVSVEPRYPWPSAYRGSKYSLVSDDDFESDDALVKWEQLDLSIYTEPPRGLRRAMTIAGKSGGFGSFRVTAHGEVITKVEADEYSYLDRAPVSEGWIPVYLGKVFGEFDFDEVNLDPPSPEEGVSIWSGLPFHHGERWAVSTDETLVWKWRDYRFESAFDHPELIRKYDEYRPNPGRLYITEQGHVWANIPHDDVMPTRESEIRESIGAWRQQAEAAGDAATLRLVNRRLVATSQSDDPADGHLPIHLGHLREFDGAVVPKPVVTDEEYYLAISDYENVWE